MTYQASAGRLFVQENSRRFAMIRTSVLALATVGGAALCGVAVPSSAAETSAALAPCGNAALKVGATQPQGATGHGNLVLRFKNRTTHSCTLYGYPGLDALNGAGHVIAHAKRTVSGFTGGSTHGVRTIVLAPGHYASADVEWMNFHPTTGTTCRFSVAIAITPAGTSHTVQRARSVSVCNLQVHPTVAGRSGNG
jgi:Protein of unknown function (DUF4232)